MNIKQVAIIGAGVMGSDVALDLACYDFSIILKDISTKILDESRARILKDFRMAKMMKPSVKNITPELLLSRITFSTDYSGFAAADLIIENVTESWETKSAVFREIAPLLKKDAYCAVNTSCIPITRLSALLPAPDRVIGLHFMNPVPLKKMVETIRGYHTSDATIAAITAFLNSIEKNPVVVNDSPGFVANRLSHLFMNEAAFLVQDGVATPEQIDAIFKQGYGHKMGPLETADLIGLDTVVNSLQVLYDEYQDPKFRCCPLLKKMIAAGLLGRKSGAGFFKY